MTHSRKRGIVARAFRMVRDAALNDLQATMRSTLLPFLAMVLLAAPGHAQADTEPLVGTVLDPDGKPVAGVRVEAWRAPGQGMGGLDLEYAKSFARVAVSPTDRHGRFALHLPVGLPCQVRVDHPPHARWIRDHCVASDDLPIRLEAGTTFTGRLKAHDGSAATGTIRAWHRETHTQLVFGRTDDAGAFRFDRLPACPLRVEVLPDAAPSPPWRDLELTVEAPAEQEFQLEAGRVLRGRVIEAATGKPITGARIGEGWTLRLPVTTNDQGEYERRGFGSRDAGDLYCQAAGFVEQVVKADKKGTDALTVDFRMERGLAAAGRVVDPAGKPMAGVYVQVFGTAHDGRDQVHDCIGLRTDAEGRFRTSGLRAQLDHVIVVRHDGWAALVYALPPASAVGTKNAGDIAMRKPHLVRGVVRGPDGSPRINTKVILWGYNDDRHRLDPNGNLARTANAEHGLSGWPLLRMYVAGHEVRTDAKGRFVFGDVATGTFHVTAYDERNGKLGTTEPFAVAADPEPIELTTDR